MRKKINYIQLCQMISENKAPERIFVGDDVYVWHLNEYKCGGCELSENYFLGELCKGEIEIEFENSILTVSERAYLRYIIKPFRDQIKFVKKCTYVNGEYIQIAYLRKDCNDEMNIDSIILPEFEKKKYYKNVTPYVEYKLEELGL
jgi:hypothetical protein